MTTPAITSILAALLLLAACGTSDRASKEKKILNKLVLADIISDIVADSPNGQYKDNKCEDLARALMEAKAMITELNPRPGTRAAMSESWNKSIQRFNIHCLNH